VIVSQATINQIRGKVRRRVLELPVKHGRFGELKKCPARKGGIYTLEPRVPYEQYATGAESQPTRARAVIALIDLCEASTKTVTITVTNPPERHDDRWLVRFVLGARQELFEQPRFPAAGTPPATICRVHVQRSDGSPGICGRAFGREFPDEPERCRAGHPKPPEQESDHGYTSQSSRALKGAGEAVPASIQTKLTEKAKINHETGLSARRERLLAVVSELRLLATTATERKRLRSVEHQIQALEREARAA
jgi:hypothetical protein